MKSQAIKFVSLGCYYLDFSFLFQLCHIQFEENATKEYSYKHFANILKGD